jgi:hypothetical protein
MLTRRLTVSTVFQPSRRGGTNVPHLRLTGRWLESVGFPAGARVHVEVAAGQIVIKPESLNLQTATHRPCQFSLPAEPVAHTRPCAWGGLAGAFRAKHYLGRIYPRTPEGRWRTDIALLVDRSRQSDRTIACNLGLRASRAQLSLPSAGVAARELLPFSIGTGSIYAGRRSALFPRHPMLLCGSFVREVLHSTIRRLGRQPQCGLPVGHRLNDVFLAHGPDSVSPFRDKQVVSLTDRRAGYPLWMGVADLS